MEKLFKPVSEKEIEAARMIADGATTEEVGQALEITDPKELDRVMANPGIRGHLALALDRAGAGIDQVAETIAAGMKADRFDRWADREVADHPTRIRAAELNLKARGELREGPTVNMNLFDQLTNEQVAMIAAGAVDMASLVKFGPRFENPIAAEARRHPNENQQAPGAAAGREAVTPYPPAA